MSRRHPVAYPILVVALLCATLAAPPDRASAQGTGAAFAIDNAVTVHTDYDAQLITVTVGMAFYSRGCPAGTSCTVPAGDVAAIVAAIELYWNGFNYKCFKVVVKVTPRTVQSQADVGPSEVDVGLDSTPVSGIVSSVRAVDPTAQYLSDDPAARVIPQHDPSHPTTWAAQSEFHAIWAHEFGHILGLHDNYDHDNRQVLPGASQDLMFASRFGVVSQEMIDRVVRRSGQVDEQKIKCGYQFELSGSGQTRYLDPPAGGPVTVTYHYWGLLCPDSHEWKIWEHVESHGPWGDGPGAETFPPGPGSMPVIVTFDDNGMPIASSWAGFSGGGKMLIGSFFTLSPPLEPTTVTAHITAGDVRYYLPPVTVPVERMDGSFGSCEAGS